jgi:L-seryl-tRNA(Ser) seleniumtransferase
MSEQQLRQIPAVDQLLASDQATTLAREFSRDELVEVLRRRLEELRGDLRKGEGQLPDFDSEEFYQELRTALVSQRQVNLRQTINATGIVIHTNLGRAPLALEALAALVDVASGYSNLEYDLTNGKRGSRYAHVESLLKQLTGAEAALVVNNCAAAVVLALATFAKGGEVIASRGELVEIGGSFRMPDVIAESGATMVEVGTTNKTRLEDYSLAINDKTRLILSTHTSNYRIVGFTGKPSLAELAELAHQRELLLIEDLGSGTLVDLQAPELADEPTVSERLASGVDLITFSGDKLLGGPQAGLLLGRAELINTLKKSPLLRALRIDKLSLAALEATLRLYLPPNDPHVSVPVLNMLGASKADITTRARELAAALSAIDGVNVHIDDGASYAGGGALPATEIPTTLIKLQIAGLEAEEVARRLRACDPPVIARIADDALVFDLRTVLPRQHDALIAAIQKITT